MADEVEATEDHTVEGAAAALEVLFNLPAQVEATPETPVIQSQPDTAQAAPAEANTGEEVKTPASEAAPVTEQPKAQPSVSPEMELRLSEAEKVTKEAATVRDQALTTLNVLVPQLVASIKGRFPDINTDEDLARVGQTDPARYNEFVLEMGKLQRGQTAQRQAQEAVARETQANEQKRRSEELGKLQKVIPDFADPEKGRALEAKLLKFAESKGIKPSSSWGAAEVQLLHEAMTASEAKASQESALKAAQAKAKDAPPVQKPGSVRESNGKDEKVRDDFQQLQKSGHWRDAARVFGNILN